MYAFYLKIMVDYILISGMLVLFEYLITCKFYNHRYKCVSPV